MFCVYNPTDRETMQNSGLDLVVRNKRVHGLVGTIVIGFLQIPLDTV